MLRRSVSRSGPVGCQPSCWRVSALETATPVFRERHELARQRQAVIAANPRLQEREMLKRTALASAMADALRRRGVTDPAASLAAEVGVIAFKTAYARWHTSPAGVCCS